MKILVVIDLICFKTPVAAVAPLAWDFERSSTNATREISYVDKAALELALRLKDAGFAMSVSVLTTSDRSAEGNFLTCRARGVDRSYSLLRPREFQVSGVFPIVETVAHLVADSDTNLILFGQLQNDRGTSLSMPQELAKSLRCPVTRCIRSWRLAGGTIELESSARSESTLRLTSDGLAVATVEAGSFSLRYASLPSIMRVKKETESTCTKISLIDPPSHRQSRTAAASAAERTSTNSKRKHRVSQGLLSRGGYRVDYQVHHPVLDHREPVIHELAEHGLELDQRLQRAFVYAGALAGALADEANEIDLDPDPERFVFELERVGHGKHPKYLQLQDHLVLGHMLAGEPSLLANFLQSISHPEYVNRIEQEVRDFGREIRGDRTMQADVDYEAPSELVRSFARAGFFTRQRSDSTITYHDFLRASLELGKLEPSFESRPRICDWLYHIVHQQFAYNKPLTPKCIRASQRNQSRLDYGAAGF